jgi:hypothetical protein
MPCTLGNLYTICQVLHDKSIDKQSFIATPRLYTLEGPHLEYPSSQYRLQAVQDKPCENSLYINLLWPVNLNRHLFRPSLFMRSDVIYL